MTLSRPNAIPAARGPILAGMILLLGMAAAYALVAIQLCQRIYPDWDATAVFWACLLGGVEAISSYWAIKRLPTAERRLGYYRLTEWVLLAILIKVFTEARGGFDGLWLNILAWPQDFPFRILNGDTLLNLFLIYTSWQICTSFTIDLHALQSEQIEEPQSRSQPPLRRRIQKRYLGVSMLVILFAAMARQVFLFQDPPPVAGSLLGPVLGYFVSGIALLSLTRFAGLLTQWRTESVAVPVQVTRRWLLYGGTILAGISLLAVWLPGNYGMGLQDTLRGLLDVLLLVFNAIFVFVALVFGSIASLFGRLFGVQGGGEDTPAPEIPEPDPVLPTSTPLNLELIRSILFWGVLLLLTFIALRQYLAYNRDLFAELKQIKPLRFLQALWRKVRHAARNAGQQARRFVRSQIERMRSAAQARSGAGSWDYVNLRRLSPRQKVLFYYLALLRRAGEAGLPRQSAQTPLEYEKVLERKLEDRAAELEQITAAFLEARYSRHAIPAAEASRSRTTWERLRKLLRTVRRGPID
jgi:hypothetical protein